MGASSSTKQPKRPAAGAKARAGPAVPVPAGPPYNGHPIYYHHIIFNAQLNVQANIRLFQQTTLQMQATNVEDYYPQMAAMYAQGYRMLVFVALPSSTKTGGFGSFNSQVNIKLQAIFRKLLPEEMGQQWELRVEKSMLVNQMFRSWNGSLFLNHGTQTGSTTDSSPIFQTLNNITQNGGRLISVEVTGTAGQQMEMQQQLMQQQAQRQMLMTGTMPMMQVPVDVFYEVSSNSSERYVYQVVNCPMQSQFQMSMPHGRWVSVTDWQGVMTQYLGTGWRLVDIFEDFSVMATSQMSGLTANLSSTKNCLWIFEKPASRINDNTPLYEGTMVEHWFTSSTTMHGMGFGGVEMNVTTNWEGTIDQFGRQGWQVVRILSTPDTKIDGMFTPTMHTRQLIFFQRLIEGRTDVTGASHSTMYTDPVPSSEKAPHPTAVQPPAYNELYGEKS